MMQTTSPEENIEALARKVQELIQAHGFWNTWSVRLIAFSVVATALYFFAQWMTNRRGDELNKAQANLTYAKDEQLKRDLGAASQAVGETNQKAAEANERAAKANER